ncbi:sugar ABC transporter permease [Paenibacillus albiflavus]|uniref:Sugar ABC transporter permease n=2 Tax=Paenibacillus albiflavus TaxID=2545760 RepID=A0A4R4E3F8_9BACL|nr:sugar ABC transporter permease [Paenibacillus albiflavus]TCZ73190.1 sugar ABC transporter permease [Paenibacillus albiflavus]
MNGVLRVSKRAIAVFVLPCLLMYVVFVFVPILVSFYYSLAEWTGIGTPKFIGFQNYVEMFTNDSIFWPSVYRTLIFALFSVGEIPIVLWIAILMTRYLRRPNFLISSYFLPVILSVVVVGQLWSTIYNPASLGGMLNKVLIGLGLESWTHAWLSDPKFAMYAIYFVALWQYLGYHILIQFTGIQGVPKEIYEAARIDGAEGFTADRYITIPLVMPIIKISIVLAVIGSLKAFDMIMVMTAGGPAHATDVISTHMYNMSFLSQKYGYGSAISSFLVVECLVATVLLNALFRRSENQLS